MEYNSGVSMILPESIGSIENDFDDDEIVREQKNQNEVNDYSHFLKQQFRSIDYRLSS
jgi:hypothetical protein